MPVTCTTRVPTLSVLPYDCQCSPFPLMTGIHSWPSYLPRNKMKVCKARKEGTKKFLLWAPSVRMLTLSPWLHWQKGKAASYVVTESSLVPLVFKVSLYQNYLWKPRGRCCGSASDIWPQTWLLVEPRIREVAVVWSSPPHGCVPSKTTSACSHC